MIKHYNCAKGIIYKELLRFFKQKSRFFSALVRPLLWYLFFQLDLKGVFVSGGSACSSGSTKISPVLEELGVDKNSVNLRFSFSRFNTKLEIEQAVFHLLECLK